jgi:hypothetical protein
MCALGRIRTLNPQSRNLVFYPVELRMHFPSKKSFLNNIKSTLGSDPIELIMQKERKYNRREYKLHTSIK